ncbi:unnamed protein product [Symbiodinium natans]|uniref:Uncharacterized protein n=1 Tax=Symbiodinium natans TaxID=878477 RepID=A0A812KQR2_9DINO|nr:unnamed protein product [Symbiodinium natans]
MSPAYSVGICIIVNRCTHKQNQLKSETKVKGLGISWSLEQMFAFTQASSISGWRCGHDQLRQDFKTLQAISNIQQMPVQMRMGADTLRSRNLPPHLGALAACSLDRSPAVCMDHGSSAVSLTEYLKGLINKNQLEHDAANDRKLLPSGFSAAAWGVVPSEHPSLAATSGKAYQTSSMALCPGLSDRR